MTTHDHDTADPGPSPLDAPAPTCPACGSPLRPDGGCDVCDSGRLTLADWRGRTMAELTSALAEIDAEVA